MHNKYIYLLSLIVVLAFVTACNPDNKKAYSEEDIKTIKALPETHISFICEFYPNVVIANNVILEQRKRLIKYRDDFPNAVKRNKKLNRLNKIADKYRLTDSLFRKGLTKSEYLSRMDKLLFRVDVIPEKLVMAQAIIESGWGSSEYAKSINNYFGIHCNTPGCGKPPSAVDDPKFWVKSFPGIEDCIEEYLWLLNTGFAYKDLRETRLKLQKENNFPNAMEMAKGLKRYSEKGNEYVKLVQSIIKNYLPNNLNAFVDYHQNATP